jgi:cytochrome c
MRTAALLAACALLTASAAYAADADILKSKGCVNCHAPDAKKAGPSLKDLTAKHKDNKAAVDEIAAKMKAGKGHPKVSGSDADIKAAVAASIGQ